MVSPMRSASFWAMMKMDSGSMIRPGDSTLA
jgi:hypothetical protein